MLSSALYVGIYSGAKNCIWLQALTLVLIFPKEGKRRCDGIKQKPLKNISTSFWVYSLKIHKETLLKKTSKEKVGPVRCIMLVLSGIKALKMFNLVNCTRP